MTLSVDESKNNIRKKDSINIEQLLVGVTKGDRLQFEKLYSFYINKVYGYLRNQIDDEFLIDDIIQEIFISIWKNAKYFNGCSSVNTWVFSIARNKLMDSYRKKYKTKFKYEDISQEVIDNNCIEDSFSEEFFDGLLIKDLLQSLPKEARELIYLVYNMGMSYKEISGMLNIPEGTVKSRVYNLKMMIKKRMEKINYA